jgi:hypothetical protein
MRVGGLMILGRSEERGANSRQGERQRAWVTSWVTAIIEGIIPMKAGVSSANSMVSGPNP